MQISLCGCAYVVYAEVLFPVLYLITFLFLTLLNFYSADIALCLLKKNSTSLWFIQQMLRLSESKHSYKHTYVHTQRMYKPCTTFMFSENIHWNITANEWRMKYFNCTHWTHRPGSNACCLLGNISN